MDTLGLGLEEVRASIVKAYPSSPTDIRLILSSGRELCCHRQVLFSCDSPVLCQLVKRAKSWRVLDLSHDDEQAVLHFVGQLYSKHFPEEKMQLSDNGMDMGLDQLAGFLKLDPPGHGHLKFLNLNSTSELKDELLAVTASRPNVVNWILQNYCRGCHPKDFPVQRGGRNGKARALVTKSCGFRDPEIQAVYPKDGVSSQELKHFCVGHQGLTILSYLPKTTIILQVEQGPGWNFTSISGGIQTLWPQTSLLIANQAGLVVDDLKLHNVQWLTLSGGRAREGAGSLIENLIEDEDGEIIICGKGLRRLGALHRVSLMARRATIGASVSGVRKLEIVVGANLIKQKRDWEAVSPPKWTARDPDDDKLALEILNQSLVSANQLLLGVSGSAQLTGYSHVVAKAATATISKHLTIERGSSIDGQESSWRIGGDLRIAGGLVAARHLTLHVGGHTLSAPGSRIYAPQMTVTTTGGGWTAEGCIEGDLTLKTRRAALSPSSVAVVRHMNAECEQFKAEGLILLPWNQIDADCAIVSREKFENNGIVHGDSARGSVTTNAFENTNHMHMAELSVKATDKFGNTAAGSLSASQNLELYAREFENCGQIRSSNMATITGTEIFLNYEEGRIESKEVVVKCGGECAENRGRLFGHERLEISGAKLACGATSCSASRGLLRASFRTLENEGRMLAVNRFEAFIGEKLENGVGGLLLAKTIHVSPPDANIRTRPCLDNSGLMFAKETLQANVEGMENKMGAVMFSSGELQVVGKGVGRNKGTIQSNQSANLNFGGEFTNAEGGHVEGRGLAMKADKLDNVGRASTIHGIENLHLKATKALKNRLPCDNRTNKNRI